MKQQLEVTLNEKTDAFKVKNHLLNYRGIKKVYVVTCQVIHIFYDDAAIQPKIIVKLIGTTGRQQGQKRLNNIIGIKEINNSTAA
jgi:hypothetical protein